jgi:hypothetical protein
LYNLGFLELEEWNVEGFRTFRKIFQFPSSGLISLGVSETRRRAGSFAVLGGPTSENGKCSVLQNVGNPLVFY